MAATLKTSKQFRSWKDEDSFEQSDVVRLFDPEQVKTTKSVNCWKYWTIYCTLVGFFALFLLGILIGFLLRVDSKVDNSCPVGEKRADGFDREKLQAVHNNIVYLMSGENIATYARELSLLASVDVSTSSERIDKVTAQYVEKKFKQFGFDKVEIEEHNIVVTSPDPLHPNRLEILSTDGSTRRNYTFHEVSDTKGVNSDPGIADIPATFMDFSPSGNAEGPLMYGNYGRYVDFIQLETSHVIVQGSVLLLKIGLSSVAEKVKLAVRYGCVGVLLFCHHGDPCYHSNSSEHTVTSARDFTDWDSDDLPTIPVQTVSHNVAKDIIESISGTSLPLPWQQHVPQKQNGSRAEASARVYLQVNNKKSSQTIYNVIATVYGSMESDREVLLGARRYREQLVENDLDSATNTGTLLELGRSMSYIRNRELWKPRRTVKFVSFGGLRKDIGMYYYLKYHRHILTQEAVTFIDLDARSRGSKVMEFKSSPSVASLLWKTADMIPDPLNQELSLVESWPKVPHDWYLSNESAVYMYSSGEFPLPHQFGIPSISLHSLLARDTKALGDITQQLNYHLASARVVSLTTLKLLDDFIIPFNLSFLLQFMNSSINHSVEVLRQHISGDDTESMLRVSNELSHLALNNVLDLHSCLNSGRLNDILMRFESVFMDESFSENLLSLDRQTGTLIVFNDVMDRYLITKNRDTINKFSKKIVKVLQDVIKEIEALKER
ncbi:glutamate carboxypeptidase 2-like [Mercenaria mercenaria]|uniref:glutamate carboxypeptidase 2-like n=1 Tax=Mercenaria mercenaria TaxID=6596 RepID=UPI00234EA3DB|nr:glutamate carboxypeptidase 2-like [Mercenaria mercenaria]